MALAHDLERIATAAKRFAAPDERLAGVLAAEPAGGARYYVCAFVADEQRSWLVLDDVGGPVTRRELVRSAASMAAVCEVADDTAGGGRLDDLRQQLVKLRLTENPEGIDEAEAAALDLERTIGAPPRVASSTYLDSVGAATRELERALGQSGGSPFADAMKAAIPTIDAFTEEVVERYKLPLV